MSAEKTKILIVDDDPFMQEILAAILEGEGYAVAMAEDGGGAFSEFCADPHIGLVLTDMNMPDMNGLELIRKIRGQGREVPAIILTGDADMLKDQEALKMSACDILVKDENVQETLASFVAGVLEK